MLLAERPLTTYRAPALRLETQTQYVSHMVTERTHSTSALSHRQVLQKYFSLSHNFFQVCDICARDCVRPGTMRSIRDNYPSEHSASDHTSQPFMFLSGNFSFIAWGCPPESPCRALYMRGSLMTASIRLGFLSSGCAIAEIIQSGCAATCRHDSRGQNSREAVLRGGNSFGMSRHLHPVESTYRSPFTTSRILTVRFPPPGLPGGIKVSISFHSRSVRSLANRGQPRSLLSRQSVFHIRAARREFAALHHACSPRKECKGNEAQGFDPSQNAY